MSYKETKYENRNESVVVTAAKKESKSDEIYKYVEE